MRISSIFALAAFGVHAFAASIPLRSRSPAVLDSGEGLDTWQINNIDRRGSSARTSHSGHGTSVSKSGKSSCKSRKTSSKGLRARGEVSVSKMEEPQEIYTRAPAVGQEDIFQAVRYVTNKLTASGIHYGIMGGLAMQLYGMQGRTTRDFDMVVDATGLQLKKALENDPLIKLPGQAADTWRISVKVNDKVIQGDIFVKGKAGMPSTQNVDGYQVLTLEELVKTKLRAFHDRQSKKDFVDLTWLVLHKASDVSSAADSKNEEARAFFAATFDKQNKGAGMSAVLQTLRLTEEDIECDEAISLRTSDSESESSDLSD